MLFSTCLFVYNARNSLSRCSNSTKIVVRWGSLERSPRPPSWIQGALLLKLLLLRGGEGEGRGRERKGGSRKIVHPEKFLRIGPALENTGVRLWTDRALKKSMPRRERMHVRQATVVLLSTVSNLTWRRWLTTTVASTCRQRLNLLVRFRAQGHLAHLPIGLPSLQYTRVVVKITS